jgi:hypothetical protein
MRRHFRSSLFAAAVGKLGDVGSRIVGSGPAEVSRGLLVAVSLFLLPQGQGSVMRGADAKVYLALELSSHGKSIFLYPFVSRATWQS